MDLPDKNVVKSWRVYEVKENHIKELQSAFENAVAETIARLRSDRSPPKRRRSSSSGKKAKR